MRFLITLLLNWFESIT